MKINFEKISKCLSTNDLSFLTDFDQTINIEKSGKSNFVKFFTIEQFEIKDFILKLENNKIYVINPFISVNCKLNDPYLNLSRQFLVTSKSNYNLINDFLLDQLETARNDFNFEDNYYFLIFKYKSVELDYRL
jgi:hypothetical protein